MARMISPVVLLVVLSWSSFAYGFHNVFVVVLENSTYSSELLQERGAFIDLSYAASKESIVSSLTKNNKNWRVYSDSSVVDGKSCTLDPMITSNFSFIVSSDDMKNAASCSHIKNTATMNRDKFAFASVGLYFPSTTEANDPDWLRKFFFPIQYNIQLQERTLFIVMTLDSQYPRLKEYRCFVFDFRNATVRGFDVAARDGIWDNLQNSGFTFTVKPPSPVNSNWFERVFVIVLENQPLLHSIADSYMRKFMSMGTLLIDYNALLNPSQPNYFDMVAGNTMNITNDELFNVTGRFIVDLFEEKGVSWKAYMEDFPGPCWDGKRSDDGLYVRKHNPFISFDHVRENETLCSKIVHSDQLAVDMAANAVPQYSFYTPNMDNNGHDTGMKFAARWLNGFLSPLLAEQSFMEKTLVVVTFDEGIKPDNKIYTLLIGGIYTNRTPLNSLTTIDMVPAAHLDNTSYTHYSLLRTVEDQFSLGNLGRGDATSNSINRANFYPGTIKAPSDLLLFIGLGVLTAVVILAVIAVVYYVKVIRKRRALAKVVPEENQSFLKGSVDSDL